MVLAEWPSLTDVSHRGLRDVLAGAADGQPLVQEGERVPGDKGVQVYDPGFFCASCSPGQLECIEIEVVHDELVVCVVEVEAAGEEADLDGEPCGRFPFWGEARQGEVLEVAEVEHSLCYRRGVEDEVDDGVGVGVVVRFAEDWDDGFGFFGDDDERGVCARAPEDPVHGALEW